MLKSRSFLILLMFFCLSLQVYAQRAENIEKLFSPSVGKEFYEIAHELANAKENISQQQITEALTLLMATTIIDSSSNYILPDAIKLACSRLPESDEISQAGNRQFVYQLLTEYVDQSADLEIAEEAIRYMLEQLNSREEREELLAILLQYLGDKNTSLNSEISTLLGLLMAEKANTQKAQFYFMQAIEKNEYNNLAFTKLFELSSEEIDPAIYLKHLRLRLSENPLDIDSVIAFAIYTEQLQLYQQAADCYGYCADLFKYLYPSEPLPDWIYVPWTLNNYNTHRNQHKCLDIANHVRQDGFFDLFVETIAAKATVKIGNQTLANQTLKDAERKANQLAENNQLPPQSLAWFYCFGLPDAEKALEWANKAYSIEPNSPANASILAYSLVINNQSDWAQTLIDGLDKNQITDLVTAQIQLQHPEQKDKAIETLKSAIAQNPATLEAHLAKELLTTLGSEYIPPADPITTLMVLANDFEQEIVPTFISPEKIISLQLSTRGSRFAYGREFDGTLTIINNSAQSLVISDDGMLTGSIRIDADISGDINKKIENLVNLKIRPALPIEPDKSITIPIQLVTGDLKQILFTYPQASLDIEFTAYLDPAVIAEVVANRLRGIKPAKVVVKRPGVKLSNKFLQNKINSISKGPKSQRAGIAQLFISLLAEQQAQANREPLYKFKYAEWMAPMLKSALLKSLSDDDWVTKTRTMAAMLSLPMDYELTDAAAANLNDKHWPVRFMALYMLAKKQENNFKKVLNWTAKYDSSEIVREMAIALGADRHEAEKPTNQVFDANSLEENPPENNSTM